MPVGRSKSVPPERLLASVNVRASCSGEVLHRQAGRVEVGMRNLVLDLLGEVQVLEDCVWNVVEMRG